MNKGLVTIQLILRQVNRYTNIFTKKKRLEKSPVCATITNRSPFQTPRGRGKR